MADEADNAQSMIDAENDNGVDRSRAALKPELHPGFDGQHCVDCDDELPPLRLAMKRVRCVMCQTLLEKQR